MRSAIVVLSFLMCSSAALASPDAPREPLVIAASTELDPVLVEQVRNAIGAREQRVEPACVAEPACAARVGSDLGADRVVAIARTPGAIGITLIDVMHGEPIARREVAVTSGGSLPELGPVARGLIDDGPGERSAELAAEASQAFNAGRFEEASGLYERARGLRPQPELTLGMARARQALGQYAEAAALYRTYLGEEPDPERRQAAEAALREVTAKLPEQPAEIRQAAPPVVEPPGQRAKPTDGWAGKNANLSIPHVPHAKIEIDGNADDAVWAGSVMIEGFVTNWPSPDKAPMGDTNVRLIADDEALYFFIDARDPQPQKITAGLGRRDSRFRDDLVAIYLDPAGDQQRAYMFSCNAVGVQMDGIQLAGPDWVNQPWDGIWSSSTKITPDGYRIEMQIPWQSIRRSRDTDKIGIIVTRYIPRSNEWSMWPRMDPDQQGVLSHISLFTVAQSPPTFGLQITPETTFGYTQAGPATTGTSYKGVSPGVTIRYSPSISTSLLATANPDYSQVESDNSRIEVNRRFKLSFDEKRPFFQEGQEWFEHPLAGIVYTRSMVSPYYGIRGTSEISGWSIAASQVLDSKPPPSVSEGGGWSAEDLQDKLALESILRVRRRIGQDSYAGTLMSHRMILDSQMSNLVIGLDGRARASKQLVLTGAILGSQTADALDNKAASGAGVLRGTYSTKHLLFDVASNLIGKDFRAENGFVTYADYYMVSPSGQYIFFTKGVLSRVAIQPLGARLAWNSARELRDEELRTSVDTSLSNGISTSIAATHNSELFESKRLDYNRALASIAGPITPWLRMSASGSTGTGPLYDAMNAQVGWQDAVAAALTFLPVPWFTAALSGSWERFRLDSGDEAYRGYVARVKLEGYATRELSFRLIGDQSTFSDVRSGEGLAVWEVSPGKAIYAGGSVARNSAPDVMERTTWQVFAKASWVFSL